MASTAAAAAQKGISKGGQLFFGSLCVGTFGLGCWQIQRLYEKLDLIEQRRHELSLPTSTDYQTTETPHRRRLLQGQFRHDKEVLIGPRGAPAGVAVPRKGLSAAKGNNKNTSNGMAPGPQGFHVLTPLEVMGDTQPKQQSRMVWINRGWVPKTMVTPDPRTTRHAAVAPPPNGYQNWQRPQGTVKITAIRSSPEKPKFITPEHDYSKRPLQLFWFDGLALQAIAERPEETILLTQVLDDNDDDDDKNDKDDFPLTPPVDSVADFKTTPAIHAGYAATWYGLSLAGIYMTRKLITRGRG